MLLQLQSTLWTSAQDRLINDRRCPNETERALKWLSLPAGPQFSLLYLARGETVRASGGDFQTHIYSVKAPEGSERWGATGRAWSGSCFSTQELN